ncbi:MULTISPECIES: hypothetical protein [unclassified Chitinophaga]|uniref:hypothetical protein n=1 Tax=unclassified Chitinophaga TaxID=2619133 RepID=UPI001180A67A|nr:MULTISPECIES: hypothetical protein [unclassified Chitinophaga]WPV64302.1 hypothetical protein QQL36_21105 [Chitinophaga sp. LS1]
MSRPFISDYSIVGYNPLINVDPNGALFFGLWGPTAAERRPAQAYTKEYGGEVRNMWFGKLHVNYNYATRGENGEYVINNTNQSFRPDGRLETGSIIGNHTLDETSNY